jgi:hypothetical protein
MRKMKLPSIVKTRTICITAAFFLILGCKENHQLIDDFAWMNNTYNPHKEISGARGHGATGWYSHNVKENTELLEFGTIETFSNEGCKFSIRNEPDMAARLLHEIHSDSMSSVDLHDIDPNSITVKTFSHYGGFACDQHSQNERNKMNMNCDHAEMVAVTRNAEPLVSVESHTIWEKMVGKDHVAHGKEKASKIDFEFDDIDYANKFTNVFRDAVKLCGGTTGAGN